jgi:hypothetical protein
VIRGAQDVVHSSLLFVRNGHRSGGVLEARLRLGGRGKRAGVALPALADRDRVLGGGDACGGGIGRHSHSAHGLFPRPLPVGVSNPWRWSDRARRAWPAGWSGQQRQCRLRRAWRPKRRCRLASPEQPAVSSATAASKAVDGAAAYRADRLRPAGVTARTSHRTRSPADSSNVIIPTCVQWLYRSRTVHPRSRPFRKRTPRKSVELRNRLRMLAGRGVAAVASSARIKLCAPGLSRVDDGSAAFVAAGEALEGVLQGAGSFDVPASARLDRTSFVQETPFVGQHRGTVIRLSRGAVVPNRWPSLE